MDNLNRLTMSTSYSAWKYYVTPEVAAAGGQHVASTGQSLYPDMDWTTDFCSAPLIGNGPFDFSIACTRHDFMWRNLQQVTARFSANPAVWNQHNKTLADNRFGDDMASRCNELYWTFYVNCIALQQVYYGVVQLVPFVDDSNISYFGPFSY